MSQTTAGTPATRGTISNNSDLFTIGLRGERLAALEDHGYRVYGTPNSSGRIVEAYWAARPQFAHDVVLATPREIAMTGGYPSNLNESDWREIHEQDEAFILKVFGGILTDIEQDEFGLTWARADGELIEVFLAGDEGDEGMIQAGYARTTSREDRSGDTYWLMPDHVWGDA